MTILIIVIAILGYVLYWHRVELGICNRYIEAQQEHIENYIPTVFDLQERLVDKGYDIGPKGIDGRLEK